MDVPHGWFLGFSSFCCSLAATWALSEQDKALLEDQDYQGLPYTQDPGQRILLWLLSLAGFCGLVWLLNDFSMEECPAAQQNTEVMDCRPTPARTPCRPRRGCSIKASLKSLGQLEEELVTLLYRLRKHKVALATGWLSEERQGRTAQDNLPNGLVIYTIQDET